MDAEIGVIGGTGLYSILDNGEEKAFKTKYGNPSSPIKMGEFGKKKIAFISRHGKDHTIPPHKVPYRANIAALASLGVKKVIGSNASGSLNGDYKPGDIVFFDQYVNMTHGRDDTFFDGPGVVHLSAPDPYCKSLRKLFIDQADELGLDYHRGGTIVIVNGPRFSTRAESKLFVAQGFDAISMTAYPEVCLAREKQMCYLGIGTITDYDNGLEGRDDIKPVTFNEIKRVFDKNARNVKKLILTAIPLIEKDQKSCDCGKML
jgi:5'-methylthioadenosine phosphorylase